MTRLTGLLVVLVVSVSGCVAPDSVTVPANNEGEPFDMWFPDHRDGLDEIDEGLDLPLFDPLEGVDLTCRGGAAVLPTTLAVRFSGTTRDLVGGEALPGLAILACAPGDWQCADPVAQTRTATDGSFKIILPAGDIGFAGHLQITDLSIRDTLLFFSSPLNDDVHAADLRLTSNSTLHAFAASLGTELDPLRGHLIATVQDCAGQLVEAAQVEVERADESTRSTYLRRGIPAIHTSDTDATGRMNAINLPVGRTLVTVSRHTLPIAKAEVFARPGFISELFVSPSTEQVNDLSCLGAEPLAPIEAESFTWRARVVEINTRAPIEGAEILLCPAGQVNCRVPVATATTNAEGIFTAEVQLKGVLTFDGHMEIAHPDLPETFVFHSQVLSRDRAIPDDLFVVSHTSLRRMAMQTASALDPEHGHAFVQVSDCVGQGLEGVHIFASNADDLTRQVYLDGSMAYPDAPTTYDTGRSHFINLPTGPTIFQSVLDPTGGLVSSVEATVTPGSVTLVVLAAE